MPAQTGGALNAFAERFSEYLPTLAGGLFVLAIGAILGWLAKRLVTRVLVWLRLDRLAGHTGWRTAFGKGDVRAALYEVAGGIVMVLVVLIFLENALQIWGLTVLSTMLDRLVLYVPNLALVALIVGVGIVLSDFLAGRVEDTLRQEGFEHGRLLGKLCKAVLLSIVGALALWQLDFARQIVLAAFLIAFGAVGVAFALAVGLGSARALQAGWQTLFTKRDEK